MALGAGLLAGNRLFEMEVDFAAESDSRWDL